MIAVVKALFLALVVAAVAATQVTGVEHGWVCECSDAPVVMTTGDCDSSQCHADTGCGANDPAPVRDSEGRGSEPTGAPADHQHEKLVLSLEAQHTVGGQFLIAPPPVVDAPVSLLWAEPKWLVQRVGEGEPSARPKTAHRGPPVPRVPLATSMVLMV